MIPTKTNNPSPCSPISSNCVVWQGPDISCIDLCNGDTVSDVVAALATKLCAIIDETCTCTPDLAGLDLKCTLPASGVPADLKLTLQAMVDYICTLPTAPTAETMIPLPACLQYADPATGNPVVELSLANWAQLVSNEICSILSQINALNVSVLNLTSRVEYLEENACLKPCGGEGESTLIIPSCVLPAGVAVPTSTLILAIETEFCNLRDAVGNVALINTAISAQCLLSDTVNLSSGGTSVYGNINGWVQNPATLAESNVNQWLAICDIYAAVKDIQDNCCDTGCSGVTFSYTYSTQDSSGDGVPDFINLNFTSSVLPSGFTDCGGSTTVTITDSTGSTVTENVIVSNLVTAPGGVNIDVTSLNRLNSLTISVPFCVSDGTSQCADTQTTIVPLNIPCPSPITATGLIDSFSVVFTNALGTGVTYVITATDTSTGGVLGTHTITNPGSIINYTFTGATAGQTYDVVVTVSNSGGLTTCPPVSVTVLGTTCTNVESTTVAVPTDPITTEFYLGIHSTTKFWYSPDEQKIYTDTTAITCDAPTLSAYSMDTSGTPGEITVTTAYGASSGTDIVLSYSTDGITYTGAVSVGAGAGKTIATGQTSGSVYLKATVTCSGPLYSIPTILRFDFNTGVWTVMQDPDNCASTSLTAACPSGVEVAQQYLQCGDDSYQVFGGASNTYWFYIGKHVVGSVTRYVYAGWDNNTNAVRSVVECCACPTFILTDPIQVLVGQDGAAVDIIVPYVLGAGEPNMRVIQNPVAGTVTTDANIKNKFTYTSMAGTVATDYADTFQVELSPVVAGTGGCTLAVATIQVQKINCKVGLVHKNQDVYAFINTSGYTHVEGGQIKTGLTALIAQWTADHSYSGNLYFIPTDSKRWLGYPKAIADDGASWTQAADVNWQALEDLPSSWPGGSGVGVWKNAAFVLVFSNESSSVYHDATLAAGFGTLQPSTEYKEDFDAYHDIINGTTTSSWGLSLGLTSAVFPEGLSTILYPLTTPGASGADAANILQMIASYTGELISPSKYGIATAVDVTSYMLQGSPALPYAGATTPGGNTLAPLFLNGTAGMLALLNQDKTADELAEINADTNEQFLETLTKGMKGCNQTAPTTDAATTGVMKVKACLGQLAPGDESEYLVTITAPAAKACGSLLNGQVLKLTNAGSTYSPGGGREDWDNAEQICVTILDNCSASSTELPTVTMGATYTDCATCA